MRIDLLDFETEESVLFRSGDISIVSDNVGKLSIRDSQGSQLKVKEMPVRMPVCGEVEWLFGYHWEDRFKEHPDVPVTVPLIYSSGDETSIVIPRAKLLQSQWGLNNTALLVDNRFFGGSICRFDEDEGWKFARFFQPNLLYMSEPTDGTVHKDFQHEIRFCRRRIGSYMKKIPSQVRWKQAS